MEEGCFWIIGIPQGLVLRLLLLVLCVCFNVEGMISKLADHTKTRVIDKVEGSLTQKER